VVEFADISKDAFKNLQLGRKRILAHAYAGHDQSTRGKYSSKGRGE